MNSALDRFEGPALGIPVGLSKPGCSIQFFGVDWVSL